MNQDWLVPRLRSWVLLLGLFSQMIACHKSGPLQGTLRPGDKNGDAVEKGERGAIPANVPTQAEAEAEAEAERISPPSNIIGSYLTCIEKEELGNNIQQKATLQCGVYRSPGQPADLVSSLNQWQLVDATAGMRALTQDSASVVELTFEAADLAALKASMRVALLTVRTDGGEVFGGVLSDLVPMDSRLSTGNSTKTGNLMPVWNEGFEGTQFTYDSELFHENRRFKLASTVDWTNPNNQNAACGLPVLQAMRFATFESGLYDNVGPAEGKQFIDTDSVCWPANYSEPIRGPSNLTIRKELALHPGRMYRVSFKVRIQPLPQGVSSPVQGLQIKINGTVVRELRNFSSNWQEVTFDWVAGSGSTKIEWADVGASNDSIGVLLDDLRLVVESF